jgi:RNA-directed DNA polymerase
MNVPEESDSGIVPMNHSNKIEQSLAESEEGRPLKENIHQSSTRPTQSGARVSQGWRVCGKLLDRFAATYPR